MSIEFIARSVGLPGTAITVNMPSPTGPGQVVTINVTGTAIEMIGATDGLGSGTSSEQDMVDALNADPDVMALVFPTSSNTPLVRAPYGGGIQALQLQPPSSVLFSSSDISPEPPPPDPSTFGVPAFIDQRALQIQQLPDPRIHCGFVQKQSRRKPNCVYANKCK